MYLVFTHRFSFISALLAMAFLSACHDSSNSIPPTSSGLKIPPEIISLSPSPGSLEVAKNTQLAAVFDQDILGTSVDDFALTLETLSRPVAGSVSFNGQSNTVTFSPEAELSVLGQYRATVSRNVTNLSGLALHEPVSWSFTTAEGQWSTAEIISASNPNTTEVPQIAVDKIGNAIAVWHQIDNTIHSIWSNRYSVNTGWGTAELIESSDTHAATFPQIAMYEDAAIATWKQSDGVAESIWSNRYSNNGGWGNAELIESINTDVVTVPQIAMDPSGNALVVWTQSDGAEVVLWSNTYTEGSGWTGEELVSNNDFGPVESPKVNMDVAGNGVLVWSQSDGTANSIWANRYLANTGWQTAARIESSDDEAYFPVVEINAAGDALAVWFQTDGASYNIVSNYFTVAAGWGAESAVESSSASELSNLRLGISDVGRAVVVWRRSDGIRNNIWSNHYTEQAGWSEGELIETDDVSNAFTPQLAMDAAGNALAVWRHHDGAVQNIWTNRFVGGSWAAPVLLEDDDTGNAIKPKIAMNRQGKAVVVWRQSQSGEYRAKSSHFD